MCVCLVVQSCPTLCDPMDCSLPGSSCPWRCSRQEYCSGCLALFQGIFPTREYPRDQTQVFHIVGRFFIIWATREAQDTGVSSLSLLQGIFPTQELNQGLLHCRQILHELSYQGSPCGFYSPLKFTFLLATIVQSSLEFLTIILRLSNETR